MFDKVVAVVTKYITEVNAMVNQVSEFAEPMKKYVVLVEASLNKHFGPIIDQITLPQFLKLIQVLLEDATSLYLYNFLIFIQKVFEILEKG